MILFQASIDELMAVSMGILHIQERHYISFICA